MQAVASLRYGVIFKKAFSVPAIFMAFVEDAVGAGVRFAGLHALEAGVAEGLRILVIPADGGHAALLVEFHQDAAVAHAQSAEGRDLGAAHVAFPESRVATA